jgi:hypothetical protein
MFDISVRFPVEDLPEVHRRIKTINEVEWLDAQAMHKAHPDTFDVPTDEELAVIASGSFIKVCGFGFHGRERFWLEVQAVEGDTITGLVKNDLTELPLFRDDEVKVDRRHVMNLMTAEEQEAEEKAMRNVASGGRYTDHTWTSREAAEHDCARANTHPDKPPHLPDLEVREVEGGFGLFWSKRRRTRRSAAEPLF